ncbi:hypothetical protein [Heyndrickxia ginsengihumi]|uniref:hypothetical protein n=1 Tax=Heyndrickxia ginsengihumi TaxID=363870 RepID=UPI00046FE7FC|nr:hypothetical protein [Heyndrickxia ginsengihumi]
MKEKISFYFEGQQLKKFNSIVPQSLRYRFIREFIKNEYLAPVSFEDIKEIEGGEVFPITLDDQSKRKISHIQAQLEKQFKITVSKSAIMRDVMKSIINKYPNAISEPERKNISFYVSDEIIKKLDKYIPRNERSAAISEFILSDYYTSSSERENVKYKTGNLRSRMFNLEIKAIDKMDDIAKEIRATRSDVFRNVLYKMLQVFENDGAFQEQLLLDLINVLNDLKEYMSKDEIIDIVKNNLNEGTDMYLYNQVEETLVPPKKLPEVEYKVGGSNDE